MKLARMCAGMLALLAIVFIACSVPAHAQVKGAIFTTLPDGSAVNYNIYASKFDVYLDGGPPPGAPSTAAGLPDGTYVFQVTDPSGKTLLSLDAGKCREFTVLNGNMNSVVVTGCQHLAGFDSGRNSVTVQLMPYADTPNNGNEYKAWATPLQDYIDGCTSPGYHRLRYHRRRLPRIYSVGLQDRQFQSPNIDWKSRDRHLLRR